MGKSLQKMKACCDVRLIYADVTADILQTGAFPAHKQRVDQNKSAVDLLL